MVSRPDWSREETILALDLYQRRWPIGGDHDVHVRELSDFLRGLRPEIARADPKFRNPAGVYRKLTNLLSVDSSRSSEGSPHASAMDRSVFAELGNEPTKVASLVANIRGAVNSGNAKPSFLLSSQKIWITGMWGFDPSRWGFLGFSDARIRDRFLSEYDPADLVLVVGQNSAMAAEADVGRLLGFLRITPTKIADHERMPAEEYARKLQLYGKDRWAFAMPVNAAWRIGSEVKVKHVLPVTYSGRWPILIGARYRQVLVDEVANLRDLRVLPMAVWGETQWNKGLAEAPPSGPLQALVTRGPTPHFGTYQVEISESIGHLYIFRLEGISADNFTPPDKQPMADRNVYKIGWCTDIKRRLKTLNSGFPVGAHLRWRPYDSRSFSSRDEAYRIEQDIFALVKKNNTSLGGEFVIATFATIAAMQAKWFSASAGKIRVAKHSRLGGRTIVNVR